VKSVTFPLTSRILSSLLLLFFCSPHLRFFCGILVASSRTSSLINHKSDQRRQRAEHLNHDSQLLAPEA
jgi:hypothetical protein